MVVGISSPLDTKSDIHPFMNINSFRGTRILPDQVQFGISYSRVKGKKHRWIGWSGLGLCPLTYCNKLTYLHEDGYHQDETRYLQQTPPHGRQEGREAGFVLILSVV